MKLKIGQYYMHENSMDVCIKIVDATDNEVVYELWNLGYDGAPYLVDANLGKIKVDYLQEWSHIPEHKLYKNRLKSGIPK